MSRMVNCQKLGEEAEGLAFMPYPGELGQRIFANISQTAWQQWLQHQTMLINEYRLVPVDPEARAYLEKEMQKFLFEGDAEKPADFVPPPPPVNKEP